MKRYLYLIIVVFVLQSCSTPLAIGLDGAEALMQERPDSALHVLESIDADRLPGRRDRAKYALLYSQALDKNYIDIAGDSLIRVAADYYRDHGSEKERFLSLYYLGRVQSNAGNYIGTLLSYMDAERLVGKLDDDYLAGLLYAEMSRVYGLQYDYPNALKTARLAYDRFSAAGYETHVNYALFDIGLAYGNQYDYDKSSEVFDKVVQRAGKSGDTLLWAEVLSNHALQLLEQNECAEARALLHEKSHRLQQPLNLRDMASLAYIHAVENRRDSARLYLTQAWDLAETGSDSVMLHFRSYQIRYLQKEYEEAIGHFDKVFRAADSTARQLFRNSTVAAQRDYYRKQSEFAEYRLANERNIHILTVICLVVVLIAVICYLRYRLRLKRLEVERYMNMAYELHDTMQSHNTKASSLIRQLFKDQFEFINRLGSTYYERQNTPGEQSAIYNDVKKAIVSLGEDEHTKKELENIINLCNDDIMHKLRAQIPQLKEPDITLFCYLCAGFSNRAICIFMQDKIENIYNRKSRLKSRIANSNAEDRDNFLDLIK